MKVSVIMPCYNGEAYLSACLDSVLAQSMADFEVIVVDDGSRDDSLAVAKAYEKKDARVRALHQENAGVSAARNLGLDHARGEWVTFVDSDDLLPEDALDTLLSGASADADMVVCAHETFDEAGVVRPVWPQSHWYQKRGEAGKRAAALRLIEGDCVLNIMCGKLIRRELIERENLRLAVGLTMAEDALFNLEAVLCGRGAVYVNRVAYRYRTHAQSATQRATGGAWQAHWPWLAAMRDMLLRRGLMERYYAPYFDSAVLRLYKDGGVVGAMRAFNEKARPLLNMALDEEKMTAAGRARLALCRAGRYPLAYPLYWAGQTAGRKLGGALAALRAGKERPQ